MFVRNDRSLAEYYICVHFIAITEIELYSLYRYHDTFAVMGKTASR